MFCSGCGNKNAAKAKFCSGCGGKLVAAEEKTPKKLKKELKSTRDDSG